MNPNRLHLIHCLKSILIKKAITNLVTKAEQGFENLRLDEERTLPFYDTDYFKALETMDA